MRTPLLLCLCASLALVGCQDASTTLFECELSYPDGEGSPPTVACPRQVPVTLDGSPAPGSLCVYEPESRLILCDDESRFDGSTGKRLADPASMEDMGGDLSDEGGSVMDTGNTLSPLPLASTTTSAPSRLWATSSCTILPRQVVCGDGARLTLAPDAQVAGACVSRRLPGYGKRLLCTHEDDTQVVYLPDGVQAQPSCALQEGVVQCEDGSMHDLTTLKDEAGMQLEECVNPRLAPPAPPEVVAACMEALECDVPDDELFECYRMLTPTPDCTEAMNPGLLCGEEPVEPEVQGTTCHAPNGVYWISDEAGVDVITQKGCTIIVGDVVIAPPQSTWEMNAELSERVDIRLLAMLSGVEGIDGSLNILHTDLPLNRTFEYDEILADLVLVGTSGDLVWQDQTGIKDLLIPQGLVHIGGQFRLADFKAMADLILQKPERSFNRFVGKDFAIQGNPFLTEMELHFMTLEGSFVLAENARLEGCELYEAIVWAYDHAGGLVLIQALQGDLKVPKNCLF